MQKVNGHQSQQLMDMHKLCEEQAQLITRYEGCMTGLAEIKVQLALTVKKVAAHQEVITKLQEEKWIIDDMVNEL